MLLRALKLAANGCSTHNLGLPHLVKVNVSEEEGEGQEEAKVLLPAEKWGANPSVSCI